MCHILKEKTEKEKKVQVDLSNWMRQIYNAFSVLSPLHNFTFAGFLFDLDE